MPELRKDPIIGRWVIIANERAKRPNDFKADQTDIKITTGADYSSYTDTTVVFEYTKG